MLTANVANETRRFIWSSASQSLANLKQVQLIISCRSWRRQLAVLAYLISSPTLRNGWWGVRGREAAGPWIVLPLAQHHHHQQQASLPERCSSSAATVKSSAEWRATHICLELELQPNQQSHTYTAGHHTQPSTGLTKCRLFFRSYRTTYRTILFALKSTSSYADFSLICQWCKTVSWNNYKHVNVLWEWLY